MRRENALEAQSAVYCVAVPVPPIWLCYLQAIGNLAAREGWIHELSEFCSQVTEPRALIESDAPRSVSCKAVLLWMNKVRSKACVRVWRRRREFGDEAEGLRGWGISHFCAGLQGLGFGWTLRDWVHPRLGVASMLCAWASSCCPTSLQHPLPACIHRTAAPWPQHI